MSLHPFIQQPFRRLDILRLATLVPTAQQDHHGIALPVKVDAITRTIVNAQLADPLSDRAASPACPYARRSRRDAINARARSSLSFVRHRRNCSVCFSSSTGRCSLCTTNRQGTPSAAPLGPPRSTRPTAARLHQKEPWTCAAASRARDLPGVAVRCNLSERSMHLIALPTDEAASAPPPPLSRPDARTKPHCQDPMHQKPAHDAGTHQNPMHHFRPAASPPQRPRLPRSRAAAHPSSRPDTCMQPRSQDPMHQRPRTAHDAGTPKAHAPFPPAALAAPAPAPAEAPCRRAPVVTARCVHATAPPGLHAPEAPHRARRRPAKSPCTRARRRPARHTPGMAAPVTHGGSAPNPDSTQDHRSCSPE